MLKAKELQDIGVARLSMGSGMMKVTLALIKKIGDELRTNGTYDVLFETLSPLPESAMAYKMDIRQQTANSR